MPATESRRKTLWGRFEAARLAALKCTVAGDQSQFSRADVDALAAGDLLRR